jgi:RNA ligase
VFNAEKMLDAAKTQEGIEGWVVQFKNGDMVKVKTEWYLRRHRAMTFLRERDIVELTLDEGLDDLKSLLVSEGAEISEIIEIENKVVNDIGSILTLIDSIIEKDGKMERKDFAIKYMNNDAIPTGVFGLLMARYTGKELNVKDWYRKNVLKEKWTLRQLVLVPTIAEGD